MRSAALVLLLTSLLAGCGAPQSPAEFRHTAEAQFLQGIVDRLVAHDFTSIEAQTDPRVIQPDGRAALERMASLFPTQAATSSEPVAWYVERTSRGARNATVTVQYAYASTKWLVVSASLAGEPGDFRIVRLGVEPATDSLSNLNAFTLRGKGIGHYLFLFVTVLAFSLTILVLVQCLLTRGLRHKWVWATFVSVGACSLTMNWSSGVVAVDPLSLRLFSAGLARVGWIGPWMLTCCLPLGAIVFLWRHGKPSGEAAVAPDIAFPAVVSRPTLTADRLVEGSAAGTRVIDGLRHVLSHGFARGLLTALVLLILYGAVSEERIAWLLLLFIAARSAVLAREALRRPGTEPDWATLYAEMFRRYASATREEAERDAHALDLRGSPSAADLAGSALAAARRSYVPPRDRRELGAEAIGLLTFGLLIPADVLMYTRDFVSFHRSQDWIGAGIVTISVALYGWPLLWPKSVPSMSGRVLWWTVPFVPALLLFCAGVSLRHPYLNPFRADHTKLAAERVLALENNVAADAHAEWVFAYARQLEQQGDTAQAIYVYREGLRLDPGNADARARLTMLSAAEGAPSSGGPSAGRARSPGELARLPLWNGGEVAALPRCAIDAHLGKIDRTTIVIVPVGEIPDWLADTVAGVVQHELSVPACVAAEPVPLPPHTRVRGLVFGRQWNLQSILQAFTRRERPLPTSPAKYVLLTADDIYADDTNFVFSWAYPWGAVVSFSRFGDPQVERAQVGHRTAKQVLGAVVKSFGAPISTDRNCVTSYSQSLDEFDAKGNRPNAESFAIFQRALRERDRQWVGEAAARTRRAQSAD